MLSAKATRGAGVRLYSGKRGCAPNELRSQLSAFSRYSLRLSPNVHATASCAVLVVGGTHRKYLWRAPSGSGVALTTSTRAMGSVA